MKGIRRNLTTSEQLLIALRSVTQNRSNTARRTMVELGAGVWVEAEVPDTSVVTVDIGLDLHVAMPITEAIKFTEGKIGVLSRRLDRLGNIPGSAK